MKQLFGWLILCASLAVPLAAGSFETTVTGYIRTNRGAPLEMAIASAQADPLWGYADEAAFKAYEDQVGPLPKVTISGSGYTNSKGRFHFKVSVSWDDSGTMPTKVYRSKEGRDVEYVSVAVIFKATAKGYTTGTEKGRLNEGFEGEANFSLAEAAVLKGGVVLAEGRKFLPNLKLVLLRRMYNNSGIVEDIRFEFSTGEGGFFEATSENMPTGMVSMRVAGNEYAFEPGSTAWQDIQIRGGVQDLGILAVVPGGSIKFNTVDAETGKGVKPYYGTLRSTDENNRFQFNFVCDADGTVSEGGVPEGTYDLIANMDGHYAPAINPIAVKAGRISDIGEIRCEREQQLDVIALGPDGGIARYTVTMVYLGDNPPPARRPRRDDEPIRAAANLTAENITVRGLFAGEWQVNVKAEGHAEYATSVTLPMKDPLKVTLQKSATIEYTVQDGAGQVLSAGWAFALLHDSAAYKAMAGLGIQELQAYAYNRKVLPAGAYRKSYRGDKFEDVPSGTYLLVGEGGHWGLLVTADDVVVKTGETVKAVMLPRPGKLTVNVTDGGKPKAGFTFYLRSSGDRQPLLSLTTGKDGSLVHEVTYNDSVWVLTRSENEWVDALPRDDTWGVVSDSTFPGRQIGLQVAKETVFSLDVGSPDQVFVRIQPEMQQGQSFRSMTMNRVDGERFKRYRDLRCAKIGDDFCFVCVPQGKYSIGGLVEGTGSAGWYSTEASVDQTGEQTIKMKVALYRLDVTLKVVDGLDIDNVRAYLRRADDDRRSFRDDPQLLMPDEDGKLSFDCLSPHDYHLFVRVYDDGNVLVNALRETIEVKGNKSVSVTVTDKVGTLSVQIIGNPLRTTYGTRATPTVYLLNSKGKVVEPSDPSLLEEIFNYSFSLPGVPVGTYTVIVAAPGFQPYEEKNVKVEKGKTVQVRAEPEQAAALVVKASELCFDMGTSIDWSYEDADGKALEQWLPRGSVTTAIMGDMKGNGGVMEFINITPEVKQVRIRVEGYKDILIKLDVKAGDVVTKDVKGEKK